MNDARAIAFHAVQIIDGSERQGCVLLTEAEAVRLENALRLARTGKLGKERPVRLSIGNRGLYGPRSVTTRLIVKGYHPQAVAS